MSQIRVVLNPQSTDRERVAAANSFYRLAVGSVPNEADGQRAFADFGELRKCELRDHSDRYLVSCLYRAEHDGKSPPNEEHLKKFAQQRWLDAARRVIMFVPSAR